MVTDPCKNYIKIFKIMDMNSRMREAGAIFHLHNINAVLGKNNYLQQLCREIIEFYLTTEGYFSGEIVQGNPR